MRSGVALQSQEIAAVWSTWLSQLMFHLLLTVTSAKVTHPEAMQKRVAFIINTMNRHYYGRRWYRRPGQAISSVIAIERHKSGNPHAHALLRFPDELPFAFPREWWQNVASETGGFCKLEIPRAQGDVIDYCCKYVVKGGELVLSENFQPLSAQGKLFEARPVHGSRHLVRRAKEERQRIAAMIEADADA